MEGRRRCNWNFPDIHLPQSRPDTTNFPVPSQQGPPIQHPQSSSEDDLKQFVAVVLADTEDVWQDIFKQYGDDLQRSEARAVLRRRSLCLRHRHVGDGTVLLS